MFLIFNSTESLKLQRNIDKYELLKTGTSTEEDKENFLFTKNSLEIFGFTNDEILSMFKIVAVIIKLGNLNFIPTTNIDGTESCTISNEYGEHKQHIYILTKLNKNKNLII